MGMLAECEGTGEKRAEGRTPECGSTGGRRTRFQGGEMDRKALEPDVWSGGGRVPSTQILEAA